MDTSYQLAGSFINFITMPGPFAEVFLSLRSESLQTIVTPSEFYHYSGNVCSMYPGVQYHGTDRLAPEYMTLACQIK